MMSTMGNRSSARALIALLAGCWCSFLVTGQETQQATSAERVARPQEPKSPLPYSSEDVSYSNPNAAGVELAGTFTKPEKNSPVPAVLLISGAGPQDRDETMAGHKPFLVLSDYLTRRGIAVLRADDRGVGKSTGNFKGATTKDFASDAEAGFHYLLTRSDVDHKHVGLIGHGEGAIAAAMVASSNPQVSFLVLLNGTAVPGQDVLLAQTARAETAAGVPEEQVECRSQNRRRSLQDGSTGPDRSGDGARAGQCPGGLPALRRELAQANSEAGVSLVGILSQLQSGHRVGEDRVSRARPIWREGHDDKSRTERLGDEKGFLAWAQSRCEGKSSARVELSFSKGQ